MPKINSDLAKARKNLNIIRSEWTNSSSNEPFSFTKKITDINLTIEEYSVEYLQRRGIKD